VLSEVLERSQSIMNPLPVLVTLALAVLGSALPAQNSKVNPPLAPEVLSGDVQEFAFTPDGTRVVYSADRGQRTRFELYSRPLDGSQHSLVLSAPMQPQGDVRTSGGGFGVGAGGRVAYLADESIDGIDELFSVPADGSSSRIRLSQAGQRVTFVQLDSSGARVAYKQPFDAVVHGSLHVAPIDGSAAPITLWPQAGGSRVWFSPDPRSSPLVAAWRIWSPIRAGNTSCSGAASTSRRSSSSTPSTWTISRWSS
jgi:hypothetical protein